MNNSASRVKNAIANLEYKISELYMNITDKCGGVRKVKKKCNLNKIILNIRHTYTTIISFPLKEGKLKIIDTYVLTCNKRHFQTVNSKIHSMLH